MKYLFDKIIYVVSRGQTLFRAGPYRLEMISDKALREKGSGHARL